MGRAAGPIRLLLAGVFLLARIALGFAASTQPYPAATHSPAVTHHEAGPAFAAVSGKGLKDAPCRPGHAAPCSCGSGLCGTALAVLPSPALLGPLPASAAVFTPDRATSPAGIRASPVLPPPRG